LSAHVFFQDFEPAIRTKFSEALVDAGAAAQHLVLELNEKPHEGKMAAEFSVALPAGPVRITWAGIASLWACAQGAERLARRMFEAKRAPNTTRTISAADDAEITTGSHLLTLSERLCIGDFPPQPEGAARWVDWAPRPELLPSSEDARMANNLFFGALGWIMRHEIAHVTLQHLFVADPIRAEIDADREATEWLRGNRQADPQRDPGSRPAAAELGLEQRAILIGMALVWVAIFEARVGRSSVTHPPPAERFFRCFSLLGLREDSGAAEILHDILQAWIAPTEKWGPEKGYPNAQAALDTALQHLYEHLKKPLDAQGKPAA
jgi:hypothetical protein